MCSYMDADNKRYTPTGEETGPSPLAMDERISATVYLDKLESPLSVFTAVVYISL